MKKSFARIVGTRFIAVASALICLVAVATSNSAITFKEARVTQIVKDVKVVPGQAAARPAVVSEVVRTGSAVRTGTESRSELTFPDLTITRLGANTIFSFNEGTRTMNLADGAILFQVPKGQGGATIKTVAVTATITGTTGIAEFHPAKSSNGLPFSKWLCLEGTFHLTLANGESIELGPGKLVTTDGKSFSPIQTFDIARLVATSLFFTGFDTPLPADVMNLIALEEQRQLDLTLIGTSTTNPLNPITLVNTINQGITAQSSSPGPTATAPTSPTPIKFGTPSTITAPNPYVITNGTIITTDPSITTNGVTDFGKIYRGRAIDGAFSLWAFGSSSRFDAIADDVFFANPNHFPIAAFKFQSLSLNGNPTIDLSNGGVTKLALIGVDGITSGPPGGPLTFTGLDLLVLATVNGSINLTSDVSFQGLPELAMYARGTGSDLTLHSPITNVGILELAAQGSILLTNPGTMNVGEFEAITGGGDLTLRIGGPLLLDGKLRLDATVLPGDRVTTGANLIVSIGGNLTNSSATEDSRLGVTNEGAHIGTGGNIAVNIGGNLTTTGAAGDFELIVQNTNGRIDNGGNITLNVNGNISTQGELTLLVENADESGNQSGHIGSGGNISVTTGGDLTAASINALINNRNGGSIGSGGNMTFNVGGDLTTQGDALFVISNRNDGNGGGTIGGDVVLALNAASVSIGGGLVADVSTNTGGSNHSSTININTRGNFTTQGSTDLEIENAGFVVGGMFLPGGTITTNAIINLSASNISAGAPFFSAAIFNDGGGHIGGDATINVMASNAFNIGADALLTITNSPNGAGTPAGTIDSDAILRLSANSASIAGVLTMLIDNSGGGSIGGNASENLDVSGNVNIGGDAMFSILNHDPNDGGTRSGTIGSDAILRLGANNASIGGELGMLIDNSSGGSIGGNATVNVGVSGAINIVGDANFQILNNDGGRIRGDASVLVTTGAGGDFTANSVLAFVNNHNNGMIDSASNIIFNIGGAFTTQHDATFVISNLNEGPGGGTITSDAIVDLNAASLSIGGAFETFVGANAGGSIGGNAINTVNVTGDLVAHGPILATIQDTGFNQINPVVFIAGGHIGGNAIVTLSGQNITTFSNASGTPGIDTVALEASIYTNGSGVIGGAAIVNVLASHNISAPGTAFFTVANGNYMGFGGGTIFGGAQLNVSAVNFMAGTLVADIYNYNVASIGGSAITSFDLTGNLTTQGDATFRILNFGGGSIGQSADINLTLTGDFMTHGEANFTIDNSNRGMIETDAAVGVSTNDISNGGAFFANIYNSNGGSIGGNALVSMSLGDLTSGANADFTALVAQIDNRGGSIGASGAGTSAGNAIVGFLASGNVNAQGDAFLQILNYGSGKSAAGTIGGSAVLDVSAVNFSTAGFLYDAIDNSGGGSINGDADLTFNLNGDLTTQGEAGFFIFNGGGAIGGNAAISVNATNITADSLVAQIDNTKGTVGIDATIDMNVSGTATVTNDATVAIFGSDATKFAGININGGNYDVGGTFLAYMDGNGTITFNNANLHADVLKAGVFGAGGALNIGGGILSADTTLKLYASGSNGQLNFVSNVTLGGNSTKILAADSVTIFNNVVVTIGGTLPADVYTNHANYSGFGGNGTTTGTFAGAGANNPQPLANAPPFGSAIPSQHIRGGVPKPPQFGSANKTAPVATRTGDHSPSGKTARTAINVRSSDELLSLLDDAARSPYGKLTIRDSKAATNSRGANGKSATSPNAANRLNRDFRAAMRTASLASPGRSPQ